MAGARGHTPATSCFRRRPGGVYECHADPHVSLSFFLHSPWPLPLSGSLPIFLPSTAVAADKLHRSHRRPFVAPSCQEAPPSSTTSSRPSPERSLAPETLHRARPQPRPPEIVVDVLPPPKLPRARFDARCTHRELLSLLPLATSLELPSNPVGDHGRELGSAGHVTAEATGA